jgi:hypothetical protein
MQRTLQRFCLLLTVVFTSIISANAQNPTDTVPKPTSVDPNLLAWQNASRPKEYTIASIKVTGVFYLDSAIVASISGLQVVIKFCIPAATISKSNCKSLEATFIFQC